jgi:iron complex outermembrane receptor protein
MDSIEVLRGPAGHAVGPQLHRRRRQHADGQGRHVRQLRRRIEGGLGSYDRFGARAAFNLALGDTFAIRAAFVHEQHDGYVDYQKPPVISLADQQAAAAPVIAAFNLAHPDNPIAFRPLDPNTFVQGGPKYDAQDQSAARLSFLWKPDARRHLERLLREVPRSRHARHEPDADPASGRPASGRRSSAWRRQLDRDVNTFRSRVDWNLSDYLSLAYIAGYSDFKGSGDFDQSGGASVPTSFTTGGVVQEDRTNWSHYKNWSHEVELQSVGKNQIDWILGAYYAAEDNGIRFDIPISNGTQQGTINWQGSFIQPKETVQSEAVFSQATWNVSDSLHLTGGARFTWDDRKNEGGINWGWDGTNPNQLPIDPATNPAVPGRASAPRTTTATTPAPSRPGWAA